MQTWHMCFFQIKPQVATKHKKNTRYFWKIFTRNNLKFKLHCDALQCKHIKTCVCIMHSCLFHSVTAIHHATIHLTCCLQWLKWLTGALFWICLNVPHVLVIGANSNQINEIVMYCKLGPQECRWSRMWWCILASTTEVGPCYPTADGALPAACICSH